jgi:hypothetical protein
MTLLIASTPIGANFPPIFLPFAMAKTGAGAEQALASEYASRQFRDAEVHNHIEVVAVARVDALRIALDAPA